MKTTQAWENKVLLRNGQKLSQALLSGLVLTQVNCHSELAVQIEVMSPFVLARYNPCIAVGCEPPADSFKREVLGKIILSTVLG